MFNRSSVSDLVNNRKNNLGSVIKAPLEVESQPLLSQHFNNNLSRHTTTTTNTNTSQNNNNNNISEFSSLTKLLAAGSYAGSSIAIQLINKITLTTYDFPSANFVALFQCIFVVVALSLAKYVFGYTNLYPTITLKSIRHMMPLSLIQVLNVGFGLFGTKAISIPMFTALRRLSVLLTLLGEMYFLRLPTTRAVICSVGLLVAGALVAAVNDLNFDGPGYWAVTASAVATTAYGVISKQKLSGSQKMTKWEVLYINSLVMMPFFVAIISVQTTSSSSGGTTSSGGTGGAAWQEIWDFPHWTNPMFCICFALTSCLGFWLNFFILFNTQVNGPLSTTIVGTAKNIFTTYLGMMGVGGDYIFSWPNFWGLNMSMGGALWYSFTKIKEDYGKERSKKAGRGSTPTSSPLSLPVVGGTNNTKNESHNNNNNSSSSSADDEEAANVGSVLDRSSNSHNGIV